MAHTMELYLGIGDEGLVLEVARLEGREAISELFAFTVDVIAPEDEPVPDALEVDERASLKIVVDGSEQRAVHGILERVELAVDGTRERPTHRVRLVPRMSRAGLIAMQRIHMAMSLEHLVAAKLEGVGLGDDDMRLQGLMTSPSDHEFVVQYRESDAAFIARMCEHRGIAFHFVHAAGHDCIVFTDNNGGFVAEGPDTLEISDRVDDPGKLHRLVKSSHMIPRMYMVYDYNYRTPGVKLCSSVQTDVGHGGGVLEYAAHFKTTQEGDDLAKVRAEERECRQTRYLGESSISGIAAGLTTRVLGSDVIDDDELLITSVEHRAERLEGGGVRYSNHFEAVGTAITFRPQRATPKPKIHGLVTGVVSGVEGSSDELAQLDEFGRYRIEFHFDGALGALNLKASRPVRMAQPFAGSRDGMHFPLKPGTEVAVAFANGDPDRPIIVGALPNHERRSVVVADESTVNRIQTNDGITIQFGSQGS